MNNDSSNDILGSEVIVRISNLVRRRGREFVLEVPALEICRAHVVGLVGLNGAGKTTLLNHLVGYSVPDSGECHTLGTVAQRLEDKELARIGYVTQQPDLIKHLRADELLCYTSSFYDTWDTALEEELVRQLDIDIRKRVSSMSPGEYQKLAIVLATAFRPDLLLMDEPAAALDPVGRAELLNLILRLVREEKTTVIISSHVLTDIEKVADSILMLHRGKLLRHCTLDDFREETVRVKVETSDSPLPDFPDTLIVKELRREEKEVLLLVEHKKLQAFLEHASQLGIRVESRPLSTEEAFRAAIGRAED